MTENVGKGKGFSKNTLFEFNGKVMDFSQPRVMGILNVTPDSFYDGGHCFSPPPNLPPEGGRLLKKPPDGSEIAERWYCEKVEKMVKDGAYIVDIGAVSTRPGAVEVGEEEEKRRLLNVLKRVRKDYPDLIISMDTYRAEIARMAVEEGADMINDISGGTFDPGMFPFIGKTGIPYILMHIQGTPATMQEDPKYDDVVKEVYSFLEERTRMLNNMGNQQLIVDPGFGFGKSVEHNFTLLNNLDMFNRMGFPVMAGLSRKRMINRVLGTKPEDALNGTTVLNTMALLKGADILRVHDVREAVEAVKLVGQLDSWQLDNRTK
jgi:dihydropteroate synthase